MKTKEEYFRDAEEERRRKSAERKVKWCKEINDEIFTWSYKKLKEEYIKCRLSRISYGGPVSSGIWDWSKEECRFCGLEYVEGAHDDCCDDCFEGNKNKIVRQKLRKVQKKWAVLYGR